MMGEFTRIIHVRVPWGPGGLGRGFGKCRGRIGGVDPEQAAKVAIARRAKPGAPPGYVRLFLSLELRQALAEQLSAQAIREGKNLEGVVIDLLEAGSRR